MSFNYWEVRENCNFRAFWSFMKWTKRKNVSCSGIHCGNCGRRGGYHERVSKPKKICRCVFPRGFLHPARSPGLNPQDFFIFNQLNEILKSMGHHKNLSVLKCRIKRAMEILDREYTQSFYDAWNKSLPRRWKEIKNAAGKHVAGHWFFRVQVTMISSFLNVIEYIVYLLLLFFIISNLRRSPA